MAFILGSVITQLFHMFCIWKVAKKTKQEKIDRGEIPEYDAGYYSDAWENRNKDEN